MRTGCWFRGELVNSRDRNYKNSRELKIELTTTFSCWVMGSFEEDRIIFEDENISGKFCLVQERVKF